jgi:hypothetical protein
MGKESVLETEQMETQGNCFRFCNRKCIKWVKKVFHCQSCYLLGSKFYLCGDILKGQCAMLIKWENFCAFFS